MRVPSLNSARQTFETISARTAEQARLQGQIASGLRVRSPGDDPAAAAQADLARSRLAQLAQDRRAVQLAGSVLETADGALARGSDMLQTARDLLVAAGNGGYTPGDRGSIAQQLRGLREELLQLANSPDGAGGYVFGGQGTTAPPLSGTVSPTWSAPAGNQRIGEQGRFDVTVDGREVFMELPRGNGVFATTSAPGNTGSGWISAGSVADATQLTGHTYSITIGGTVAAPTYTVADTTAGTTLVAAQPFTPGAELVIDGQQVRVHGTPAPGDTFLLAPAGRQSVFATLDDAIALLESAPTAPAYNERLERVQTGLDRALEAAALARTRVGESLRSVEAAGRGHEDEALGVTTRRSGLQDVDVAQAISELQSSQTIAEAAMKTYAQSQRRSLFDLLS